MQVTHLTIRYSSSLSRLTAGVSGSGAVDTGFTGFTGFTVPPLRTSMQWRCNPRGMGASYACCCSSGIGNVVQEQLCVAQDEPVAKSDSLTQHVRCGPKYWVVLLLLPPSAVVLRLEPWWLIGTPGRHRHSQKQAGALRDVASPCLLYTSPSPRDQRGSRMPSSA